MAIKIGLDAGHGLKTAGKQTPDGIKEWVLNDAVRDKVARILSDYDCEIIHTDNNEGNTDEALSDRLARYKKAGVNAFVSIHHNAYTGKWNSATGVEVYVDRGGTKQDYALANCIYNRLVKYTGLKGRGVKEYNFWVINQDTIPAVLVEGGFMDSRKDYEYIITDEGQEAYARAVAEGLIEFLNLKKKTAPTPTPTPTPTYQSWIGYVNTQSANLNVRKGAGTSFAIVGKLPKGSTVTIVGKNGAWYKVAYNNIVGYVSAQYISAKKPTSTPAAPSVSYFKRYAGSSGSLVDALKAIGATSTFAYRKKIANANGVKGYVGNASQNTKLLELLKKGKLIKP